MKVQGAVVLITGASSGIGRTLSLAFDRAGARVAMAARRRARLEENAAAMDDALVLAVDLADPAQARAMVDDTVKKYGRIDVLINNAARIMVSRADEVTPEMLERSFAANVIGPVVATNRALGYMRSQGYGHIINVSSPGFMIGIPLYVPYVCSKAAMTGWTRSIQAEWAGSGIMVSEYFPGYIKTDSPAESAYGAVDQDALMDQHRNAVTRFLTRPKSTEDVARQILRLVEKPRPLVCSGFLVRLGTFLSNFDGQRRSLAGAMAVSIRARLGLTQFSGK